MGYALAPDVHACVADDRVYFLDAGRDRYCKAGPSASQALIARNKAASTPDNASLTPLVEAGLLTFSDDRRARLRLCTHPSPSDDLHGVRDRRASPRLTDIVDIAWLALLASRRLRRHGFADALRWAGVEAPVTGLRKSAIDELARCVACFEGARTLLPTSPRCLLDSLILRRWCSARGIATAMVIGIRPLPFAAHCWVEHEGVVLNGSKDSVANFKPICVA
ncbi:lasso peptide biosynthesis B2 protein [Sphingomonas sp. ID1715]|uniref:lasso peptide biosynthesis B2 protein n=1 Tax=Sphingomonas sp. ID1715 TaxID=1656898 RepID=UPI001C2C6DA5|nr:lasso peptide biosynthesis B2 protein [Sphingomonas sp. ID1715]